MSKTIICGCDLHDRFMLIKFAVDLEQPMMMNRLANAEGRQKMITDLKKFAKQAGATRIVFAYEASGAGFGLFDQLTEAGIECYVIAPSRVAKSSKEKKNKTDEKDAQKLLELLRGYVLAGNPLPTVWIPPAQVRDDRDLLRMRISTKEDHNRIKLQILSLLKRNKVVLVEYFQENRNWSKRFVAWLESTVAGNLFAGAAAVLRVYLRRLQELHEELLTLNRAVADLAVTTRYQDAYTKLRELPGVGQLTAMLFLTELGDLTRFSNRRQVAAFLGLCPSSHESGETNNRKGHITRQGPSWLRKVLCQAAWTAVRCDDATRARWERIRGGRSTRGKKAIVAVMRQLAIQMWHVALSVGVDKDLMGPLPADSPSLGLDKRESPPSTFAVASTSS